MGQRRRKRGRRAKPPAAAAVATQRRPVSRSEQRNAAVRATLTPLAPGERPWVITVGATLAALNGLVQLILFVAGVKFKVGGSRPAAFSVILFAVLMFVCAGGMLRMRYWAVLGFQALLAIVILTFAWVVLFLWPTQTDHRFAWTIQSTMTAMLMGAGYGSALYFFAGRGMGGGGPGAGGAGRAGRGMRRAGARGPSDRLRVGWLTPPTTAS